MSPIRASRPDCRGRFPRVSGDEPGADELVFTARRFSPRERG